MPTTSVACRDVATLAATDWSYELVETALGSASVLPALVSLAELRVRLTRYQITAIESAAQAARETINAFLTSQLRTRVAGSTGTTNLRSRR